MKRRDFIQLAGTGAALSAMPELAMAARHPAYYGRIVVLVELKGGNDGFNTLIPYDDDHYYLGGVIAEALHHAGCRVTLVTPANCVSAWTEHTLEQHKIQTRLLMLGILIITSKQIKSVGQNTLTLSCIYSENVSEHESDAVVMVTSRTPSDQVYQEVLIKSQNQSNPLRTLKRIGDCLAPSTIAAAVYSGHLAAREFGQDGTKDLYRRESLQSVQ